MISVYGLTEAGAMIFMHPANCEIRPGSCGIPLPGVACKVVIKKFLNLDFFLKCIDFRPFTKLEIRNLLPYINELSKR